MSELGHSDQPLASRHDTALVDLDGVVYVGPDAVPGAVEGLAAARDKGMRVAFVTNNASRTPDAVAAHLRDLGLPATAEDVVTSAQAAARMVAERVAAGSAVLVVGGEGLEVALAEHGLRAVRSADDEPAAVVQGFAKDVGWVQLAEGALTVARGVPWIASNLDRTLPTARGLAPGNGALVDAITAATGARPEVAGKPELPLHQEAVRRTGSRSPLVVGDRLDTDIEGAHAIDVPSLLVLTGVSWLPDLAAAAPELRPTYISPTLEGLFEPHPVPTTSEAGVKLNGWTATVEDGRLGVTGQGSDADWWRVAVTACWRHLDETGTAAEVSDTSPPGPVRQLDAE